MMRLVLVVVLAFGLSLLCFAAIKVISVLLAIAVYGDSYTWGIEDVKFVLIRGLLMGLVFSTFAVIHYIRLGKRS
jgi:hypothetical protein